MMVVQESWENKCCRCEGDLKANLFPGKRVCHMTCGPCLDPEDWEKCTSCEIVGHCRYALDHLKSFTEVKKGCYFDQQLSGDKSFYHTLSFMDGQQQLMKNVGEKTYLESLKKANATSVCLQNPL